MDLQIEINGSVLLARLSGEIDLAVTDAIRSAMDAELEGSRIKNIIINLSAVAFIDSTGLGVLLGRYRKIARSGGKMFLVAASPQVRRILEISGLLTIMTECPDEKRAMDLAV
jgi:stage II sporulation protein AA (anti-sigma F factor antagonist)